jgi:hypothetical protein
MIDAYPQTRLADDTPIRCINLVFIDFQGEDLPKEDWIAPLPVPLGLDSFCLEIVVSAPF